MTDAVLAFATALLLAGAARLVAGPGLGTLIGGLVAAIAPAAFAGTCGRRAWIAGAGVVLAIAVVWLGAGMSVGEYVACVAVIGALVAGVGAVAWMVAQEGRRSTAGFAIAVILATAWVSWPLWLAQALVGAPQALVQALVVAHPLFAINRAAARFGMWGEQSVAYGLTNIGQDVPYAMPGSIWPCVIAHVVVAALFVAGGFIARRAVLSGRRSRPTATLPA